MDLPIGDLAALGKGCGCWNINKIGHGINSTCCNGRMATIDNEQVFEVLYPKDSFKPQGAIVGGIGFYASPSCLPSSHAKLHYQLRPAENFEWVKGGKLPGLYIGEPGASGGRHADDKASCRVMWRPNGQAEAYVYLPPSVTQCPEYKQLPNSTYNAVYGDSLWRGLFTLQKAQWNQVTIEVRLNTVGAAGPNADGLLAVTINGVTQSFDKMTWRMLPDVMIQGITFDTFFGGSDESWRTPVDTSICFKGFRVECLDSGACA